LLLEAGEAEKRNRILICDAHNAAVHEKLGFLHGGPDKIPFKRKLQFWSSRADKLAQTELGNLLSVCRQSGLESMSDLPIEGRSLLRVSEAMAKKAGVEMPSVKFLEKADGMYSYYGLEEGLIGKSIGNYHHDLAAWLENVALQCPKMYGLYHCGAVTMPKNNSTEKTILGPFWHSQHDVQGSQENDSARFLCHECNQQSGIPIPHFFFHYFSDGVQVFENSSRQNSMEAMLGRVHAVAPCRHNMSDEEVITPATSMLPFLISVFHGSNSGKPQDVGEWMQDFIQDLNRLDQRRDVQACSAAKDQRSVTAQLTMVIADGPARQMLKQCKGVSGYYHCEWCTQKGDIGTVIIAKERKEKEKQQAAELERIEKEKQLQAAAQLAEETAAAVAAAYKKRAKKKTKKRRRPSSSDHDESSTSSSSSTSERQQHHRRGGKKRRKRQQRRAISRSDDSSNSSDEGSSSHDSTSTASSTNSSMQDSHRHRKKHKGKKKRKKRHRKGSSSDDSDPSSSSLSSTQEGSSNTSDEDTALEAVPQRASSTGKIFIHLII
jgi:hypothetical protein